MRFLINTYIVVTLLVLLSCNNRNITSISHITDNQGNILGDSIFLNGLLSKIVFKDSFFIIDSIVYQYWDNDYLRSIYTYKDGKNIFENIEFDNDDRYKSYRFISINDTCIHEREYGIYEQLIELKGPFFFNLFISGLNFDDNTISEEDRLGLKLFLPDPPYCEVKPYIINDEGRKNYVFEKNEHLNYLYTASFGFNDSIEYGINKWTEIRFCFDVHEQMFKFDTTYTCDLPPENRCILK